MSYSIHIVQDLVLILTGWKSVEILVHIYIYMVVIKLICRIQWYYIHNFLPWASTVLFIRGSLSTAYNKILVAAIVEYTVTG